MARLNKSTGLFGMGGGKRKGAKSKFRDFLDQRKKGKASRMQAKRFKKMSDQERYESMMAAKQRRADFMASRAKSAPMAKPATSATTSTTRDVMTKEEGKRIMENNERAMLNRKNKANAKVGEMFEIIDSKGKKQKVMKKKAMYGSKVKAVKKAPGGASMKKMPEYKKGGALKSVPSDAKGLSKLPKSVRNNMGYMENGGKVKKRTTTVTENTPSRFSKFTDAQKAQIKARGEKLKGEDKKDFDYDVARSKDTKSKTTTTTKRRSGKVKSQSIIEKRKSSIPGRSTDVTTTSKKRRGGSTRVKTTSYGAGDDRDAGRVVKQKFNKKGGLKKTKVLKAMYGAKMKK